MPITSELITQQDALRDLTDDQKSAFVTLAENQFKVDLKKEVDKHTGEIYSRLDQDIEEVTGEKKPDGVKTYEFMKKKLSGYKSAAEKAAEGSNPEALKAAQAELAQLKKQVAEGTADVVLKKKLETTQQLVNDYEAKNKKLQDQISTMKGEHAKALSLKDLDLTVTQTDFAFAQSLQGITFKSTYSESAAQALVASAKSEILANYTPEIVRGADGQPLKEGGIVKIQFRNKATGEIELNAANHQNPFTPGELLMSRLKKVELIDEGRRATGAGTGGGTGGGGTVSIDAVRGAKTKPQADAAIRDYLAGTEIDGRKVTTSHPKFREEFSRLRKDHNVASLPYV